MMREAEFRALAGAVDRTHEWGDDDNLGALHFLTAAATAAAVSEVRSGQVVSCADRRRGVLSRLETSVDAADNWLAVNETITFAQHGAFSMTHFDALGHFFYDGTGHAGHVPGMLTPHGLPALTPVAASRGIVGRGLLLDLPAIVGTPYLELDRDVRLEEILAWLTKFGTVPRKGDILFVRTGAPVAPPPPPGGFPNVGGLDLECARWVHDERFSLVVSDAGLDSPRPIVENVLTPWHILAIARMGISLVDVADLEELAGACRGANRCTFMAVVSVLPLAEASASPVNPIAVL
jgi:hypothetical protein